MPRVSVIWPYWERSDATLRALVNFRHLYPKEDIEIIIADDGSPTDPMTEEKLAWGKWPWPVKLLSLPKKDTPLDPCVPINRAVEVSSGTTLLLTNPETTHRAPIIPDLEATLMEYGPLAVAIAAVYCPDRGRWHSHSQHASAGYHFCNMLTRVMFELAGGFDEDYRDGQGYDDPDFVERLKQAGAVFAWRDDLVADHHKLGATIEWPPGALARNKNRYLEKWPCK